MNETMNSNEESILNSVEYTKADLDKSESLSLGYGDFNETGFLLETIHHTKLDIARLAKIYSDRLLCDVILVADGLEIYAHKLILTTCSILFYLKFSKDKPSSNISRIEIDGIDYNTLLAVVDYFYKTEITINEQNVENLLHAAYILGVRDLQSACYVFILSNLNPNNCIRTLSLARRFHKKDVINIAEKFVGDHFKEIVSCDNFINISYEELLGLIKSEIICATEEELLKCVILWTRSDSLTRKQHIFSLMENIRFSLISPQKILENLEAELWLISDLRYNAFLREIFICIFLKGHSNFVSQPRLVSTVLIVAGIAEGGKLDVEMFDFQSKTWLQGPQLCLRNNGDYNIAILGTKIYLMDRQCIQYFDIGKTSSDRWIPCNTKMEEACGCTIAVLSNQVYAVGGATKSNGRNAKRLDATTTSWIEMENMLRSRYDPGLGSLTQKLYAVGGRGPTSYLVECYNSPTNTWSKVPPMLVGRCRPGVAAFQDNLLVVGGYSGKKYCKEVESFDPKKNIWCQLPNMNIARYAPGIMEVNNQLYVVGGYNKYNGYLNSIEVYDPEVQTWSDLPSPMNTGKVYVATAIVGKEDLRYF